MKISTKGRYALRMLLDLAEQPQDKFLALKDISDRQNISKKYLEQIIPLLHKENILESVRGNNGGYKLKKSASEVTLFDILNQTENEIHIVQCLEEEACFRDNECIAKQVWLELDELLLNYLKETSLQDIIHRKA